MCGLWVKKTSHADNHYLDAEVYAMAAADTLGIRMLHLQGDADEESHEVVKESTPEEEWIQKNESWIGA